MKNKKIVMIIRILLIIVVIASLANTALAYAPDQWNANENVSSDMEDIVGNVLGFVQILGSAIAVIMIVVLGIKYMMGSAEEKAEYKKTYIPLILRRIFLQLHFSLLFCSFIFLPFYSIYNFIFLR